MSCTSPFPLDPPGFVLPIPPLVPHHGHPIHLRRPRRRRRTIPNPINGAHPASSTYLPYLPHRALLPRPLHFQEAPCRSQEPAQGWRPGSARRRRRNGRVQGGAVFVAPVSSPPGAGNPRLPLHARGAPRHHPPLHAEAERPPGGQPRGQQGAIRSTRAWFGGVTGLRSAHNQLKLTGFIGGCFCCCWLQVPSRQALAERRRRGAGGKFLGKEDTQVQSGSPGYLVLQEWKTTLHIANRLF